MLGLSIRGLGTLQKRHSYQACVIPVLTYGLPLWFAHDGVGVKKFLLRINKVHSHACKWIVGCFRTTPIGAREVMAGLPPLVLLLNSLLHGFRARIVMLLASHILRSAMEQRWTNPAYAAVLRKTRPAHLPSDVPFRRLRTHLVQEQFEHRILNLYHHLPILDTAHTTPLVCLLAVVVRLLGPLLGPKMLLLLLIDFSPFSLTPLSS